MGYKRHTGDGTQTLSHATEVKARGKRSDVSNEEARGRLPLTQPKWSLSCSRSLHVHIGFLVSFTPWSESKALSSFPKCQPDQGPNQLSLGVCIPRGSPGWTPWALPRVEDEWGVGRRREPSMLR